jgi:probable phosphoglycerate mutase
VRNGRVLVELLGARLATIDFVSSPLLRARETMEIVRREAGLPPTAYRTDERLREMHYGHWEGQLLDELPKLDPEGFAARRADLWGWQPRGGESYRMLSDRVANWLAEIEQDAVVVAHGGVSRVLRGHVVGLCPAAIPRLEVPQDKVLILGAGYMRWL